MDTNGIDKIHKYLQNLGLTDYQARVVSCLFIAPQMSANELSESTGIGPKKVYKVLSALVNRSIINHNNTKPRLFVAEAKNTIANLIETKQQRIDQLKLGKTIHIKVVQDLKHQWESQLDTLFGADLEDNLEQWI